MKFMIFISFVITYLVNPLTQSYIVESGWLGILPIKSKESEVESKLGKPKENKGFHKTYETDKAIVSIVYSDEPCSGEPFGKMNVEKGTVLSYSVGLKGELKTNDLHWDKSKFRIEAREISSNVKYFNSEKNISLSAVITDSNDEFVSSIFYYIPSEYKYLRCNKLNKNKIIQKKNQKNKHGSKTKR